MSEEFIEYTTRVELENSDLERLISDLLEDLLKSEEFTELFTEASLEYSEINLNT